MLKEKRDKIDEIDQKIIKLLDERYNIAKEIGEYKKNNNIKVFDSNRENEIVKNIINLKIDNSKEIFKVYKTIIQESKNIQK